MKITGYSERKAMLKWKKIGREKCVWETNQGFLRMDGH